MLNTEIWKYLKSLNPKELKQLKLWVQSPAFNRRKEVARLFNFLEKNLTSTTAERNISKEKLWEQVFLDQPLNDKKLHYTIHYLLRLTQRFIAFLEMENDPQREQLFLCKSLKKRQLHTFFEREMRSLDQMQSRYPHADAEFQFARYQFHAEQHEHLSRHSRSAELPFQPMLHTLGDFFMATLLRYACSAATRATVANQQYDLRLLPEVLRILEETPPDPATSPAVSVYYRCYRLLDGSGGDDDFFELKNFLKEQWRTFPLSETADLWLLAINYGIKRLNSGTKNFIRETFELYRDGLEKGILPGDGTLSNFTYKNIARLGLGLQEYDWTERFLHDARRFLEPATRENTFRYNLAVYHFYLKNYDEAMRLLTAADLDDVFLNLDARSMLLRIYFENGYADALDSLLDSFQTFVKRQKTLGYQAENYLNLIRFTRQLLRLPPDDLDGRQRLREAVETTELVAERAWLLTQIF